MLNQGPECGSTKQTWEQEHGFASVLCLVAQDLVQNQGESPQNVRENVVCDNVWFKTGGEPPNVGKHVVFDPTLQPNRKNIFRNTRTVIALDLCAKGFYNLWPVEPFANPIKLTVTKGSIFAGNANIVRVLSCTLVRPDDGIVAVDSRRNTRPNTLAIVAAFNE